MHKLTKLLTLAFELNLALGFGSTALAAPALTKSGSLFCCVDAGGKQACGDILPQACYGRAYRELGESGRTLRNIEAPLTAEQSAQRKAEEERHKAEEIVLKEKQRKDQALLDTYSSVKDIEIMRSRTNDDIQKAIKGAETKILETRAQRKNFENEAEFYKKKQLPPEVQKGLRDADSDIKAQELIIESKKKELDDAKTKYDDERRRFLEITKRGATQ